MLLVFASFVKCDEHANKKVRESRRRHHRHSHCHSCFAFASSLLCSPMCTITRWLANGFTHLSSLSRHLAPDTSTLSSYYCSFHCSVHYRLVQNISSRRTGWNFGWGKHKCFCLLFSMYSILGNWSTHWELDSGAFDTATWSVPPCFTTSRSDLSLWQANYRRQSGLSQFCYTQLSRLGGESRMPRCGPLCCGTVRRRQLWPERILRHCWCSFAVGRGDCQVHENRGGNFILVRLFGHFQRYSCIRKGWWYHFRVSRHMIVFHIANQFSQRWGCRFRYSTGYNCFPFNGFLL